MPGLSAGEKLSRFKEGVRAAAREFLASHDKEEFTRCIKELEFRAGAPHIVKILISLSYVIWWMQVFFFTALYVNVSSVVVYECLSQRCACVCTEKACLIFLFLYLFASSSWSCCVGTNWDSLDQTEATQTAIYGLLAHLVDTMVVPASASLQAFRQLVMHVDDILLDVPNAKVFA